MQKKINVLLITDEAWNDKLFPNNNMTNWFTDFDRVELAHVFCSDANPDNECAIKYFQITDKMMLNSILKGEKAGVSLEIDKLKPAGEVQNVVNSGFNSLVKKISKTHSDFLRLCRDMLWLMGKYDTEKLRRFIEEFNPDLIFTQRVGSVKLCRLERIIKKLSNKPMIALTGDNEYSLKMISFSPFFWIRRFMVRGALNKTAPFYDLYYTSSHEQAELYKRKFNIPAKIMVKCGVPDKSLIHNNVNSPIRIVYAGKLYCGRWTTLATLGEVAKRINKDGVKVIIDIYSRDNVTRRQLKKLNDNQNIFFHGAVSPDKLPEIYSKSDVVLHVESMDKVNRLVTQHSYSTKVIDCLSSGCAVMAIGWERHSACVELKKADAALVATNKSEIEKLLKTITNSPEVVASYANKAMQEIEQNHSREKIQEQMYGDFSKLIKKERF